MKKNCLLIIIFFIVFPIGVFAKDSSINKFSALGTGRATKVELNDQHCGFISEGCRAKVSGEWKVMNFDQGKFSLELNTAWQNSTPNGMRGYCAPINGTAIFEPIDKINRVFVSISGTDCDVLFSSEVLPHRYYGKFVITGGTGKYVNAEGGGDFKAIDYGKYKSFFLMNGIIKIS